MKTTEPPTPGETERANQINAALDPILAGTPWILIVNPPPGRAKEVTTALLANGDHDTKLRIGALAFLLQVASPGEFLCASLIASSGEFTDIRKGHVSPQN